MWLIPSAIYRSVQESGCWIKVSELAANPTLASGSKLHCTVSGRATPRPFSWRGWKARPWSQHLFGAATLKNSTDARGVESLTQFARGFLVSHSLKPESEKEPTTSDGSGQTLLESLAKWDRASSSWRTCQVCLFTAELSTFSERWPNWISVRNAECFQQKPWEPRISGKEFSSWLTPHGFQGNNGPDGNEFSTSVRAWQTPAVDSFRSRGGDRVDEMGLDQEARNWRSPRSEDSESCGNHQEVQDSLTGFTKLWPTPNTPSEGPNTESTAKHQGGLDLDGAAANWPTPCSNPAPRGVNNTNADHHHYPHDLALRVESWPTPNHRDADKWHNREPGHDRQVNLSGHAHSFSHQAQATQDGPTSSEKPRGSRQRLNPAFVCWLMGFPWWWTNPAPISFAQLAMESWLAAQRLHLQFLLGE